jgi:5-methylcytosine-specific restriction endonuclease McrA
MAAIDAELNEVLSTIARLERGAAKAEQISAENAAQLASIIDMIRAVKRDGSNYQRPFPWLKRHLTPAAAIEIADLEARWRKVQSRQFRLPGVIDECRADDFVHQARWKMAPLVERRDELTREQARRRKIDDAAQAEARRREKARADAVLAQRVKDTVRTTAAQLKPGLRRDHDCPYCGSSLGADPHADHIHPVAKGGLSTPRNMVMVCSPCNGAKRDLTLNQFISSRRLDRDMVFERLSRLGKDY